MDNTITNLSRAGLTAAGVARTMTPAQARAKANAELIIVIVPGDGEFYYAAPDGYGCSGVAHGSWEPAEAAFQAAGWIVEVTA